MSHKTHKIAGLIQAHQGGHLDAHYLGYFECFNQQLFFEAHEILEELWLAQRAQPKGLFYKGLIQLAGAFVHVQKERPGPARALFRLAANNLSNYPSPYEFLDLSKVQNLISIWIAALEENAALSVPGSGCWPNLSLEREGGTVPS
jgi:predicted metal-dependent hydrolase